MIFQRKSISFNFFFEKQANISVNMSPKHNLEESYIKLFFLKSNEWQSNDDFIWIYAIDVLSNFFNLYHT